MAVAAIEDTSVRAGSVAVVPPSAMHATPLCTKRTVSPAVAPTIAQAPAGIGMSAVRLTVVLTVDEPKATVAGPPPAPAPAGGRSVTSVWVPA